ncbi:MAG: hypothetical protein RBR16_08230 [Syntrophus sp. (in: bacteria)]|nr:hypothetical protein [Syntrophus sp. (in: bacteria)]
MNLLQVIILIVALICSALIVWDALPIEFPGVIFEVFMLIMKLVLVSAVTIVAYVFAGRKKTSS